MAWSDGEAASRAYYSSGVALFGRPREVRQIPRRRLQDHRVVRNAGSLCPARLWPGPAPRAARGVEAVLRLFVQGEVAIPAWTAMSTVVGEFYRTRRRPRRSTPSGEMQAFLYLQCCSNRLPLAGTAVPERSSPRWRGAPPCPCSSLLVAECGCARGSQTTSAWPPRWSPNGAWMWGPTEGVTARHTSEAALRSLASSTMTTGPQPRSQTAGSAPATSARPHSHASWSCGIPGRRLARHKAPSRCSWGARQRRPERSEGSVLRDTHRASAVPWIADPTLHYATTLPAGVQVGPSIAE